MEIDALLGRAIPKQQGLQALEARQEITERMIRYRWLAIETARAAGATWAEIDTALDLRAGLAQTEYETALTRQQQYRLVAQERQDPRPVRHPGSDARTMRPLLPTSSQAPAPVAGERPNSWTTHADPLAWAKQGSRT